MCMPLYHPTATRTHGYSRIQLELMPHCPSRAALDCSICQCTSKRMPIFHLQKADRNSSARSLIKSELWFLDRRYPNGGEWLNRTLDSGSSHVQCFVAMADRVPIGSIILKKKSVREAKISTFYIKPQHRGYSAGRIIFRLLLLNYFDAGIDRIHITHCEQTLPRFCKFLNNIADFEHLDHFDRYFCGRKEVISVLNPHGFA